MEPPLSLCRALFFLTLLEWIYADLKICVLARVLNHDATVSLLISIAKRVVRE